MPECKHEHKYWGAGWIAPNGDGSVYCNKCKKIIDYDKGIERKKNIAKTEKWKAQ